MSELGACVKCEVAAVEPLVEASLSSVTVRFLSDFRERRRQSCDCEDGLVCDSGEVPAK